METETATARLEKFYESARELISKIHQAKTEKSLVELKDELEIIRSLANSGTEWWVDYDIRRSQETIGNLESEFDKAKAKFRPRRRFHFKAAASVSTSKATSSTSPKVCDEIVDTTSKDMDSIDQTRVENGMLIVKKEESEGREVRICNVTNAKIIIEGFAGTVRVSQLRKCTIKAANVNGPVYVVECEQCIFWVHCRQLRVHNSENCDFRISGFSTPIIEKCPNMIFRKWGADAKIEKVLDFSWLKEGQSPNWKICEQDEINDMDIK